MSSSRFGLIVLVAATLALEIAAASEQVLRFSTTLPGRSDIIRHAITPWVEEVNKELQGEVRIDLFPGGSLGRHTQAYLQMVRDGVVDFAVIVPSYYPGQFPDNDMFQLPLTFTGSLEASLTAWRLVQAGELRGLDGLRVMALYSTLPYGFHLNFEYRDLGDLDGRKIRTMGLIQAEIVEALGGTPIGNVIAAHLAETIGRGLVDGALFGWDNVRAFGVRQVTSSHVPVPLSLNLVFIGMNPETYSGLSPRARAVFDETMGVALIRKIVAVTEAAGAAVEAEADASTEHSVVRPGNAALDVYRQRTSKILDSYINREPGNQARYDSFRRTLAGVREELGAEVAAP